MPPINNASIAFYLCLVFLTTQTLAYRQMFKMLGACEIESKPDGINAGDDWLVAAPCFFGSGESQWAFFWTDEVFSYTDPRPEGVGIPQGYYNAVVNVNVDSDQPTHSEFTWKNKNDDNPFQTAPPVQYILVDGDLYGQLQAGDEITICSTDLDCKPCWGAYQEWDLEAGSCGCIADYEYHTEEATCEPCAEGAMKPFAGAESCRIGDATRLTFMMRGECNDDPDFRPCMSSDNEKFILDREFSGNFQAVVRRDWMSNPETNKFFDWDAGSDGQNWINLPQEGSYIYKEGDSVSICSDSGTFPADQDCSPCYDANMDWDVSSGSCACLAGYERVYDETGDQSSCNPCLFNFSKAVHGPEFCMEGCIAGYEYDTSMGSCTQCPFGFSKHYPGTDACIEGCVAGYEYDMQNGSCTPCPSGLSKNYAGTEPCIEGCIADFELIRSTGNCTKCPVGFNTPESGSHFCICDAARNHVMDEELNLCGCIAGYEYDTETGVCSSCATDFEKLEPGAHTCTLCPIGTHTPENGPHTCLCDEDRNHVWDPVRKMCGCIAGFGFSEDTGFCRKCTNPFFKEQSGAHGCTKCIYNTWETSEFATHCERNFDRLSFLMKAECPFTVTGNVYPCFIHWPQYDPDNWNFQSIHWNGVTRTNIQYGYHKLVIRLRAESDNPEIFESYAHKDYISNSFYDGIHIPLGDGEGESGLVEIGDEIILCKERPEKNTRCETPCYAAHQRWDRWTHTCGCIAGYQYNADPGIPENEICQRCPHGFSKSASGSEQCIEGCIADFEYDTNHSVCKACALGFTKDFSGPGSCKCEGVHTFDTNLGLCGCIANYGYDADTGYCKICPVGFSKGDGAQACSCVGGNRIFDTTLNSCGCIAGFEYDKETGICEACPAGFSKADAGQQYCTACATGFYTAQTGSASCQLCQETTEYESPSSCKCVPGYFPVLEGPLKCEKCDNSSIAVNATVCVKCVDIDQNSVANSNRTTCICQREYFLHNTTSEVLHNTTFTSECQLCPEGTVKTEYGNGVCRSCKPRESNMLSISNGRMICGCSPGFGLIDSSCELCPDGTYNNQATLERCTKCPWHYTSLPGATSLSDCNICVAGYFLNSTFQCESCPRNSASSIIGSVSLQNCRPCDYLEFQPEPGKAECVRQNVELLADPEDHVVGLFVDGDTSCVYITGDYSGKTDRICWGRVDDHNESLQHDVIPRLPVICGDGIIFPFLEECDDGNSDSHDGCSGGCKVEYGFGCEHVTPTKDLYMSLWTPSRCCRILQGPLLHTGKCSSTCSGRLPPYAGVQYDPRSCELRDIDECASIFTNTCFHSSKLCVNFDAVSTEQHTYKCLCASPLPEHCTDLHIDHGAYTVRGVISVLTANVSDTMQLISQQTAVLMLDIPLIHTQTTTIFELVNTNTSSKSFFELSFMCESWHDMQLLASNMNLTALGELLANQSNYLSDFEETK